MPKLTQRQQLAAIRAKIAAVPKGTFAEMAPRMIDALKGTDAGLFQLIDNEIGNAHRSDDYAGNGWVVRSIRNDPNLGPALYATFRY